MFFKATGRQKPKTSCLLSSGLVYDGAHRQENGQLKHNVKEEKHDIIKISIKCYGGRDTLYKTRGLGEVIMNE